MSSLIEYIKGLLTGNDDAIQLMQQVTKALGWYMLIVYDSDKPTRIELVKQRKLGKRGGHAND